MSSPRSGLHHLKIVDFMFGGNSVTGGRAIRLLQQPGNAISLASPHDAIMGCEIGRRKSDAPPRYIARRSNDHHVLDPDLTRDEIGCVLKTANPHHEVDVFANQDRRVGL